MKHITRHILDNGHWETDSVTTKPRWIIDGGYYIGTSVVDTENWQASELPIPRSGREPIYETLPMAVEELENERKRATLLRIAVDNISPVQYSIDFDSVERFHKLVTFED